MKKYKSAVTIYYCEHLNEYSLDKMDFTPYQTETIRKGSIWEVKTELTVENGIYVPIIKAYHRTNKNSYAMRFYNPDELKKWGIDKILEEK